MSVCKEESQAETYYGGIVICVIIDLALIALLYTMRYMERRNARESLKRKSSVSKMCLLKTADLKSPIEEGLPEISPRTDQRDANESAGSAEKGKKVFPVTILDSNMELDTVDVEAQKADGTSKSSVEVEEGNAQLLVNAFKRGLGGENLQINFKFENLGLKLKGGKTVLDGVNGEIKAGRLTAIMGPSGAGKTTFMNVLMGKVSRTHGKLHINNREAEMHTYKKIIGYVPQEDIMLRELTVRENILHAARVKLPSDWTNEEVSSYADGVVEALNLGQVAHSIIGDETTRGVSGGQRKRVNIGLELAAVPLAMFLDEPTSGLDSTAALSVARIMKSISRLGLTIVAVIHQPRYEIFTEFDDILMIAPGGRTAYLGPTNQVQSYFESFGFEFDPRANPADILMDILSGHGVNNTRKMTVTDLVREWEHRSSPSEYTTTAPVEDSDDKTFHTKAPLLVKERGAYWWQQILYCHNRSLMQQYRNVSGLALEIFVGCFAGLLMGRQAVTNQAFYTTGISTQGMGELYRGVYVEPYTLISPAPLTWFIPQCGLLIGLIVGLAGAPAGVNVFGQEKPVYWREAASGHNRGSYYTGKSLAALYRFILSSLHFTAIYVFFATPMVRFGPQFLIILLQFWGVYGLAAIVSMVVKKENANLLAVICCLFAAVFCGYGPNLKMAKDWKILFIWEISFNKWAAEALYSESVTPYEGIYDIQSPADMQGYTIGQVGLDLGMIIVIGVVQRLIAFGLMVGLNRDKQR
ncbi:hypothetical protein SpCBS45565_g00404 [Spizellomyces sp. 'palustris']|nr:hypothetical protein SpCBS45565_g00404 [Spizellomyces sp. 'palustris']